MYVEHSVSFSADTDNRNIVIHRARASVWSESAPMCRGFMCAIIACNASAIPACNNCRLSLSNVMANTHEAKVSQPMTAFGGMTWRSTFVDLLAMYSRVYGKNTFNIRHHKDVTWEAVGQRCRNINWIVEEWSLDFGHDISENWNEDQWKAALSKCPWSTAKYLVD